STNVAQSGEKDVEIIFMGYGIDHENYSDYKGIDVKGKIVVYFKGEPIDKNKKYLTTLSVQPTNFARLKQQKIDTAIKKGALGTIRIDPVEKKAAYLIKSRGNFSRLEINSDIIKESEAKYHFFMTPSAASKLLGISETKFLGSIKKLNKGINLSGKYSSKILMVVQDKLIPTENVVGYIEGSDKKDELIIITAHYDHVGKRNDKIYNGADDNASGTVAIIEIAEAFAQAKAEGHGPRRSILFMPVTGEEKGLLGSKYYAQYKPIFPIENTVLCINMDMIGRIDKKHEEQQNYVYNSSSGYESSDLHNINLKAENNVHSDLKPEYSFVGDSGRISGGSDHYSFFTVNVPVMYFRCGIHDDYHKPTDTIEKINFKNFCNITKLVFSTAWEAANYEGEISIEE
ncbi:M28 family peptidase, partial [Bacteroidota bacterium]